MSLDAEAARRSEQGRNKRLRTRQRIVEEALALVRTRRTAAAPTIDDFIAVAGVSRGTFYNHFETKEELLQAAGMQVSHAIEALIQPVIEDLPNPAERVSFASRTFIRLPERRADWAWILVNALPMTASGWSAKMRENVLRDLRLGVKQGVFNVPDVQAAATFGIGGLALALRTALLQPVPRRFATNFVVIALQAFGVAPGECQRIARLPIPDVLSQVMAHPESG